MDIEFEQLPVNPRGAPQGVGLTHVSDEFPDGRIDERTSKPRPAAFPGPVQPEALMVPSEDRRRLHEEQRLGPVTPEL